MIRRLNLHQYHYVYNFIASWSSHLAKPLGFGKIIVLRRGTGVSFELKFQSLSSRNLVQVSWAKGVKYAIWFTFLIVFRCHPVIVGFTRARLLALWPLLLWELTLCYWLHIASLPCVHAYFNWMQSEDRHLVGSTLLEMTFLSGMAAFQGLSLLSFQETSSNSHSKASREADALLRRTLFNTWKAKRGQTT